MHEKYELRFLPLFDKDLSEIAEYISHKLRNPQAANRLIDDIENAIYKRLENPEIFAPYDSARERENPYYAIHVRNFIIFYVIDNDIMEVRRIIYARRNIARILD